MSVIDRQAQTALTSASAPMVASPPVIETRGLRKTYGNVVALDRLDLTVPRAAVGLLGPNGAGKTTLLRLLLGLARPDSGSASVLGYDTRTQAIELREHVGYMPEADCLPPGSTAADFVGHMAEISGLPARASRQRAADVLYQVGLDEERYRLIKGFSTGMKQRVKLAQAIVHDPDLVFLDEPTAGMDPQGRDEMLALITRIHEHLGIAVVLSTHILDDVERVCDYVVILDGGKLMLAQALGETGENQEDLLVRIDGDPDRFLARLAAAGVHGHRATDEFAGGWDELVIERDNDRVYDLIRDAAVELDMPLRGLHSQRRSLEDVYLGHLAENDSTTAGSRHD